MNIPHLDDRLSRAVALFPACAYGADIGADHGRLSCVLLARNICERMCVADISPSSLEKARNLLENHHLSNRADISVGDGLLAMPHAADAIAILGMGGQTICSILENGKHMLCGATLVLSAHTQIHLLRSKLTELQYRIDAEEIAFAAGRLYVVLRAIPGVEQLDDKKCFLGPRLTENDCAHYQAYLQWRKDILSIDRSPDGAQRLAWLEEEMSRVHDCE